ncbi:EGF-like domain-containing protein [Pycnococcus provasolii]
MRCAPRAVSASMRVAAQASAVWDVPAVSLRAVRSSAAQCAARMSASWRHHGLWDLTNIWDDELFEYTEPFKGGRDAAGTFIEEEQLDWEEPMWYRTNRWRTSARAYPGDTYVSTGFGYNREDPLLFGAGSEINNALRSCGPSQDRSPTREEGCTIDNADGTPGAGPQQWAYRGRSMGPPSEPVNSKGCTYATTRGDDLQQGTECHLEPAGLPRYAQFEYASVPVRWGFEEGTLAPFWEVLSVGVPNFAIVKHCFLDSYSGEYQLCSAYPWNERERNHGVLHVRSVPFTLGYGDLTFQSNGGDKTVPVMVNSTYPIAVYGEGTLGVALTRLHDNYRVLSTPIRSRRFWLTSGWTAEELLPFYGEKFVIDIYDYRCCDWGWLAVDAFVVPSLWIEIYEVVPSGGRRAGGDFVEIFGKGFGSTPDGVTVFIGEQECLDVAMTSTGSLRCVVPPGEGQGLTVSVVIGNYARNVQKGPFGGHQAGHCGEASREFPYSDCRVGRAPGQWGVPLRGYTYRDPPTFVSTPIIVVQEDDLYMYAVAAQDPDNDHIVYTVKVLPSWLRFDPATQLLAGTPRRSDVRCRADNWHPAKDRCAGGGKHTVVLTASDYFFTVEQRFVVNVRPRNSPLLLNDASFHWPTVEELVLVRKSAQAMRYHTRIPDALAMRRYGHAGRGMYGAAYGFTYELLHGRDPVESSLRSMLRALSRESRPSPSEVANLVSLVNDAGYENSLADMTERLTMTVRQMQEQSDLVRASLLSVHGEMLFGWLGELETLISSESSSAPTPRLITLREPTRCLDNGAGVLSRSDAAARRFCSPTYAVEHAPGVTQVNLVLPVSCHDGNYSSSISRYYPSCAFLGSRSMREIRLYFAPETLHLVDARLVQEDIPYSDVRAMALMTNDVAGFVRALSRRLVAYAKRHEEFMALPQRYEAHWTLNSPMLRIKTVRNISATLQFDHSYPWPTPPSDSDVLVRVVQVDGVPYHIEEAVESLSYEMSIGQSGGIAERLTLFEERLLHYTKRCINDCSGNGRCVNDRFPPVCECDDGYSHDDCSHVECPNGCNGQGACDSQQTCEVDVITGERSCVGGTSKCACFEPYYSADCSLQPCPKSYIVLDDLPVSVTLADIEGNYSTFGPLRNVEVKLTQTADFNEAQGTGKRFKVAYVEYLSSTAAQSARDTLVANDWMFLPSIGVAHLAISFPDQLRARINRETELVAEMFDKNSLDCSGRGACDYYSGQCYCASDFFGPACEYIKCGNECGGHGTCDYLTGSCVCEDFFEPHIHLGCVRKPFYLPTTLCEDRALDTRVNPDGSRVSPLYLSCFLGVATGASTNASYCPLQPLLSSSSSSSSAGPNACYTRIESGSLCNDCSGYTNSNATLLHTTADTYSTSLGVTPYEVVKGIGALPNSRVTFDLAAMRDRGIPFSSFLVEPGIVREFLECIESDYACEKPNPQCGAWFEVEIDGETRWKGVVNSHHDELKFLISETDANLTLVTRDYNPRYWLYSGLSYGGGPPPAHPGVVLPKLWCSGSAWVKARFM